MNMQHDAKKLSFAAPIEIRPFAEFKCEKARAEAQIRVREIDSASKLLADENPHLASWFIMQVRTGRESSVESAMSSLKIEALVLREPDQIVVRRGRKWSCPGRPWMPGFVLVRCVPSSASFRGLLGVRNVESVVGGWMRPYRVKPEIIMEFNNVMTEKRKSASARDLNKRRAMRRSRRVAECV